MKREAATMSSLCQTILGWDINDVLHSVIDAADTIQKAYSLFTDCNYEIFAKSIAIFARAQDATANFMAAVRDTAYKVKVLTDDLKAARRITMSIFYQSAVKKNWLSIMAVFSARKRKSSLQKLGRHCVQIVRFPFGRILISEASRCIHSFSS